MSDEWSDAMDALEGRLARELPALAERAVTSIDAMAIARAAAIAHPRGGKGPRGVHRFTLAAAVLVAAAALAGLAVALGQPSNVISPTPKPSSVQKPTPTAEVLAPFGYGGAGTIAFVRPDPAVGDNAVWLINPSGSGEARFRVRTDWTGHPATFSGVSCCAIFSPDGKRVALAYAQEGGAAGPGMWTETRILNLDGSDYASVPDFCGACDSTSQLNYVPRAWSPDGKLLALEAWSDADPSKDGINVSPTTTGNTTDWATHVTGNHRDVPIAFSPDGTQLLFVRISGNDRNGPLMVVDLPDIGFSQGRPTPGSVHQISPDGVLVSVSGYFGGPASWSSDGSRVAFAAALASTTDHPSRVFVVDTNGGSARSITSVENWITTAQWSPDGTWIAFDEPSDSGAHDLVIVRPDGSGTKELTTTFEPGICCARWSPDSHALLAAGTVTHDKESYLFIVPINGDPVRQVTTVPALYEDFSWGPASR